MKFTEHIHNKDIKKAAEGIISFAEKNKSMADKEIDLIENIIDDASSEAMDKFLFIVLEAMSLMFKLDKKYRENIKNFTAEYLFTSSDGKMGVSALFNNNKMKVIDKESEEHTISVTFKNGIVMAKFLFSPDPDIISGLLDNKLTLDGNMNYIFKFIYMARQIPAYLGIHNHPSFLRLIESPCH